MFAKNGRVFSIQRSDWAISLIGSAPFIEGATRIQKYAFLSAKTIKGLTKQGFYDDWIAGDYGPFSPSLASDIFPLVGDRDDETALISKAAIPNSSGYKVDRFYLNPKGQAKFEEIKKLSPEYTNKIGEIVNRYNDKTLMDVLHDVYYQFPEYAMKSTIKAQVGKKIYESNSYLNPEFDNSEE